MTSQKTKRKNKAEGKTEPPLHELPLLPMGRSTHWVLSGPGN